MVRLFMPVLKVSEWMRLPNQQENSVTRVICMAVSDITERKRLEEVLKQRTKDLERSNKDLEQFAYVAAHDLREPLVAVAAYLKV